jgi:hypothetical protein
MKYVVYLSTFEKSAVLDVKVLNGCSKENSPYYLLSEWLSFVKILQREEYMR